MTRHLELIIFWSVFFALFLSLMINESIRIENKERIDNLEETDKVHEYLAVSFSKRIELLEPEPECKKWCK